MQTNIFFLNIILISFTIFCNFNNWICCWLYSGHDLKLDFFFFINLQFNILIQFNYVKLKKYIEKKLIFIWSK